MARWLRIAEAIPLKKTTNAALYTAMVDRPRWEVCY